MTTDPAKKIYNSIQEGLLDYARLGVENYEKMKMTEQEELKHKFEEWFYDNFTPYTFRCEWAYGDIGTECIETREKNMKQWLMSAYYAGYERGQWDYGYETLEEPK